MIRGDTVFLTRVSGGGIIYPSDWYVEEWIQDENTQTKTFTHGLGQIPNFVVCYCMDSSYGANGRIMDVNLRKASDGTWINTTVFSTNSNETALYSSQSIGYNGYEITNTTITLTQGRYYSATFVAGKRYILIAHL